MGGGYNINMKKLFNIVSYIFVAVLLVATVAYATTKLTPPGAVANTMYTLSDIYNLSLGTTTPEGSGAIPTTPTTVAPTDFKTLTEVYTAISTELAKLTNAKIAKDISAFGFTGTLYGDTDPAKVLTTAQYAGSAAAAPAPLVWAAADVTSYNCSWFTNMTDPTQPGLTSGDICNIHCDWNAVTSQCDDGLQTGQTYITWYAGKAACANSTEGGQSAGTWRLPTGSELLEYFLSNGTPSGFSADYYWSDTTARDNNNTAYYFGMGSGALYKRNKDNWGQRIHCVR